MCVSSFSHYAVPGQNQTLKRAKDASVGAAIGSLSTPFTPFGLKWMRWTAEEKAPSLRGQVSCARVKGIL